MGYNSKRARQSGYIQQTQRQDSHLNIVVGVLQRENKEVSTSYLKPFSYESCKLPAELEASLVFAMKEMM